MSEVRDATLAAVRCIRILAKEIDRYADVFPTLVESQASDDLLRPMLRSAWGLMNCVGDWMNGHDYVDEEIVQQVEPLFEQVRRAVDKGASDGE